MRVRPRIHVGAAAGAGDAWYPCWSSNPDVPEVRRVPYKPWFEPLREAAIVLHSAAQHDVPTMRHWRLNERHYGALQGRAKQSCVAEYGIEQVRVWRNSFSTPPPLVSQHSPTFPGNDPRYAHIPPELLPRGECLKDTLARCLPLWNERIVPELRAGQSVLVVAHGHSIRALVKHLERVSDDAIADVSLPNAVPLLYHLGEHLQPLHVAETASGLQHEPAPGLRGVFLGDRSAVSSFDWMVAAEASDESSGPVPEAGRPSRSQPS